MRYIPAQEFGNLLAEYQKATSREARRIRLKLEEIDNCYRECSIDEREFADDIIKKFCELIKFLEEQNEEKHQAIVDKYKEGPKQSGWVPFPKDVTPFATADALLSAFYDRFKGAEELPYAAISKMSVKDRKGLVNSTLMDYVARIGTFANNYLWNIPRLADLLHQDNVIHDPVLFTYGHLELILASFDTKNEDGTPNKQKVNIRSALRKLNEFKREQELR